MRRERWDKRATAVAVLLAAVTLAAALGLRATAEWPALVSQTIPARSEQRAPDPEPVFAEQAAPAAGVTGTVAPPPLPAGADPSAGDAGVVAARPFSMAGASAADRGRALQCLAAAIYYEAASEPEAGQRAVAQVVLNRVRHPAFPDTVCGVVYQGSQRAGCQFSFACNGAMARQPNASGWARAERVAAAALAGGVYAPVGLATHYHTFAVRPAWNRALVMTGVVGAHFFHRWKGWWGTAAAFRQAYRGGEPAPGPHLPVEAVPPVLAAPSLPVEAELARSAPTPAGTPAPAPAEDKLPPAPEVLERWKDSGAPLR